MFALILIGAGVLCDLVLVALLLGDATATERFSHAAVALLALGGGALKLGGMMILEPRRRVG
ncbi:MAG: hypothetical protein ACK5WN_04450 [Alphaproteobacteria bacterium]